MIPKSQHCLKQCHKNSVSKHSGCLLFTNLRICELRSLFVDHSPLLLCDLFFMCLSRTLRIFRIAGNFYFVLYKGLYGWERGEESPPPGRREFTLSRWGREREGNWVGPENHIKLTTCSKEDLFFIWRLDLLILMGANTFARCHFKAQKSLDIQGPPLPMALEMDLTPSKSLRPAPYKKQVH